MVLKVAETIDNKLRESFETSEGILRNQKFVIGLDFISNQRLIYLALFG